MPRLFFTDRGKEDFMLQLTATEFKDLKSPIVTSSQGSPHRATPIGFTERGVAIPSVVLPRSRART